MMSTMLEMSRPSLLSAYKGLKRLGNSSFGNCGFCLLSAYKGLKLPSQ